MKGHSLDMHSETARVYRSLTSVRVRFVLFRLRINILLKQEEEEEEADKEVEEEEGSAHSLAVCLEGTLTASRPAVC